MRHRPISLAASAACAAASACATSPPPEPQPELTPELGSTHVQRATPETSTEEPAPAVPTASSESDALAAAVKALEDHPGDLRPTRIVAAMRALADALALLTTTAPDELEALRRATDALARLPERADAGADVARLGLDATVRALRTVAPALPRDVPRYGAALDAFAKAVAAIDPKRPLRDERPAVAAALRRASDAVKIAATPRASASTVPR